jgi:RNA polymerase sigma-70 factor, ECF subfamily
MRADGDFDDFYAANYGRTVALVTSLLGDRNEAEDIAQETFARALNRWSRLRTYEQPEAWLRRVALRLAIDSRRRAARIGRLVRLTAPSPAASQAEPDLAVGAELSEAILAMPFSQREVLVLHYLVDLPVAQIATDLRLPLSTVKTRLASGRRRLERELSGQREVVRDERGGAK